MSGEFVVKVRRRSRGVESNWLSNVSDGRAIAQAVSHWLPTAAARVRDRDWSSGNYKACAQQVGSGYFWVPPRIDPHFLDLGTSWR
jgi:hypothetical protein